MLEHHVERYNLVGMNVGVLMADGSWVSRATAGVRIAQDQGFAPNAPIGDKDKHIMGSSGKSMTSTMAARVVAQGAIRWNTTAQEMFQDTGLFQVHESFWPSTLEQFLSHSSGAPGLDVVVSEYYGMIDFIFNKVVFFDRYIYGSNSPKREFTLINAHKPAAETTSNGHKKCNLKSVKG